MYSSTNVGSVRCFLILMIKNFRALVIVLSNLLLTLVIREEP